MANTEPILFASVENAKLTRPKRDLPQSEPSTLAGHRLQDLMFSVLISWDVTPAQVLDVSGFYSYDEPPSLGRVAHDGTDRRTRSAHRSSSLRSVPPPSLLTPFGSLLIQACLVGLWLMLVSVAPSTAAPPPYEQALRLEQRGNLAGALRVLERAELDGEQAKHRTALREAVRSLSSATIYEENEQFASAEAVLTATIEKLDRVRDAYIVVEANRRLEAIQEARTNADEVGLLSEIWQSTVDAAQTIAGWFGYIVIALGFVALLWALRRFVLIRLPPRKGLAIALDDVSAPSGERAEKNRVLARELEGAIREGASGASGAPRADLEIAKDVDGSVLLNIRVAGEELATLEQLLEADTPIRLGPVAFSPRQMFALLRSYLRPRSEHELSGYFAENASTAMLAVQLQKRGHAPTPWSIARSGDDARKQAIADAAGYILFELGSGHVSAWESVLWYRRAWVKIAQADELRAMERESALEEATRLLERSLAQDPSNDLARFDLGTVLRTLGRNAEAVEQFDFLRERVGSQEDASLGLRCTVLYALAVALAKLESCERHKEAVSSFEEILETIAADERREPGTQSLTQDQRQRLRLLARSAVAAALVFKLEMWRFEDDSPKLKAQRQRVLHRVRATCRWVEMLRSWGCVQDWTAYMQARAVVENAYGRAAYVYGRPYRESIEAFEHALAAMPDFGDAHCNLASALLRVKDRYPDWDARALRHVDRVLEMSPRSRKALYLRGQIHAELGHLDEAKKAFSEAGDDPLALFRLAQLRWEEGDRTGAVEPARRSLRRRPATDYRARLFVEWVADMSDHNEASAKLLEEAGAVGEKLTRAAEERGVALSPAVARSLRTIATATPPRQGTADPDPTRPDSV